jgi:methylenetetrahydrofolate dehydrogenase (NADP+)/methenyltetrahydrofolate cyclohydrolase
MTAIKLDGESVASEIKNDLRMRIAALADRGITPGLGTLLVGDDGPSANYVSMKHRDSEDLGMGSREVRLPATTTQAEIHAVIDDFNADPLVDAYICPTRMPMACIRSILASLFKAPRLPWPAPRRVFSCC